MLEVIMRLLSLIAFTLITILWTLMSMDIYTGNSIYWGYLHYAMWLIYSLTIIGLGYLVMVTDRR